MEALVAELHACINSDVDEIGVAFVEEDEPKLIKENSKIGIPHKVVPKLHAYLKQADDRSDQSSFASLVCSG